ncbi:MAG: sigma factor, partial [Gammaproteobacteria bacterium]|nr:sigma factor [Gammaproteobacteria bacterium]
MAGVERRAFRMSEIATGNREDALDLVQDAMFKLVDKYSNRGPDDWGPLFYR